MNKIDISKIKLAFLVVFVLIAGILGCLKYNNSDGVEVVNASNGSVSGLHFIDVGQGDSILVISDGEYMLVDAGEEDYGNTVVDYLKKQNVDKLKYVVATHPHSDHIGGLDDVINSFSVENVIMPDATNNTRAFNNLLSAIENCNSKVINGTVGVKFNVGKFNCDILGPVNIDDEDINNNSVVIKLTYGKNKVLLTGDCSKAEEEDIINSGADISADILKAGHHGSSTSSCDNFVKKVKPSVAIISCGLNNDYGHPHEEILKRFEKYGVSTYRTDELGSIVAKCTGDNIELSYNSGNSDADETENVDTNKNNDGYADATDNDSNVNNAVNNKYILNNKSKKFHLPECSGVKRMKNKAEYTGSASELVEQGYSPCGLCNPK